MEKEADQEQETDIEMVNINSVTLISNHSTIIANLKTLSNIFIITVPYMVDTGSGGNTMPLYIYKKLFPRATIEKLAATRDTNMKLKTYNQTTVTQLGICRVTIEHYNKHKICNFFVVP